MDHAAVAVAALEDMGEPPVEVLLSSLDAEGHLLLPADMVEEDSLDPQILVLEAAGWAAAEHVENLQWSERLTEAEPEQLPSLAGATRRAGNLADARLVELAAGWADRHGVLAYACDVVGSESLVTMGGDGTPLVAEFCPAELGAAIGLSLAAARSLIADGLDLRHRLRLVWAGVQAGDVTPWVARKVAAKIRGLDAAAAARVDAYLAPAAATLSPGRLLRAVDAAVLAADPDRAEADAEAAACRRGFWVAPDVVDGVVDVYGVLDAPDAAALNTTVAHLARALRVLGDTDSHDVRRGKALALLANPSAALAVLARAAAADPTDARAGAHTADEGVDDCQADEGVGWLDRRGYDTTDGSTDEVSSDGDTCDRDAHDADTDEGADSTNAGGSGCGPGPGVDLGLATLYAHVSLEALETGQGVARVEDIGPVVVSVLRRWLRDRQVSVKPVIDLAHMPVYDCYETPARLAEAIWLAKPADYFPCSSLVSRRSDNEHTIPYVPPDRGGPPGQTNLAAMGRMGRHTHRIKTFSGWKVTQPRSGVWIWKAPHGHYYLVDHGGTTPLGKLWTS